MRAARLLWHGWLFHFRLLAVDAFALSSVITWPFWFAVVAFLLFGRDAGPDRLVVAALGATMMGIWSVTTVGAANALQRQRFFGTLELLVAAPSHFSLVLLPMTIAVASVGIYAFATTFLWAWLLFGVEPRLDDPLAFALAVPTTILSIGLLGFLLSVTVVRYRTAWALGNAFEYPVWLITGMLVPLSLLPGWVEPIAWALAPTWGMNALRDAATGDGSALPDLLMCLALGGGYAVLGAWLTGSVLRSARANATLSLT